MEHIFGSICSIIIDKMDCLYAFLIIFFEASQIYMQYQYKVMRFLLKGVKCIGSASTIRQLKNKMNLNSLGPWTLLPSTSFA